MASASSFFSHEFSSSSDRHQPGLGHLKPAKLRLPLVKVRRSDPVGGVKRPPLASVLLLLQDRNYLHFTKPASLHIVRLLGVGLDQNAATFQGSTSKCFTEQRLW
jgi:hypothetical protein